MDTALKQRLVGAAVLVALAVIFLPMLVKGPAPDSGVSDVSMQMPPAPESEMETRELPLVQPGNVPAGGAVGLDARPVDAAVPPPSTDPASAAAGDPAAVTADPAAAAAADASPGGALPPATAGGGYAVHFGAYASSKAAETVATLARDAGLPAYTEATQLGTRQAWRVRIGPYVTRAEAEIVRVKALEVRSDVPVRVVALDAAASALTAPSGTAPASAAPAGALPGALAPTPAASAPVTSPANARPEPAKPEAKPEPKPEARPEARPAIKPPAPKPAAPVAAKPAAPAPAAKPPTTATAKVGFAVQLGAFGDPAEAEALRQRLRGAGFSAFTEQVDTDKGRLTRVSVGPALDRADADRLKAQIQAKTGLDGFVRSHP